MRVVSTSMPFSFFFVTILNLSITGIPCLKPRQSHNFWEAMLRRASLFWLFTWLLTSKEESSSARYTRVLFETSKYFTYNEETERKCFGSDHLRCCSFIFWALSLFGLLMKSLWKRQILRRWILYRKSRVDYGGSPFLRPYIHWMTNCSSFSRYFSKSKPGMQNTTPRYGTSLSRNIHRRSFGRKDRLWSVW